MSARNPQIDTTKWHAFRIAHLLGGARAINGFDSDIIISPIKTKGHHLKLQIEQYHDFFPEVEKLGLRVVGCDFLSRREQVEKGALPDWRSYNKIGDRVWSCSELSDQWSFVKNSAFKAKDADLWDISSRISHQLSVVDWRNRDLSENYRKTLNEQLVDGGDASGRKFSTQRVWLSYVAAQAALVDACVLRDYLAEFYAYKLKKDGALASDVKVTSMSGLYKAHLKKSNLGTSIDHLLREAVTDDGWLATLAAYRNLAVHVAPLMSAGKHLFAVVKELVVPGGSIVMALRLPLPQDPELIMQSRASGEYLSDPQMSFARFSGVIEDVFAGLDALEYFHAALANLAILAWHMLSICPVKPTIPHFTIVDGVGVELDSLDPSATFSKDD